MKRVLPAIFLLALVAALAPTLSVEAAEVTKVGYLLDANCGSGMAQDEAKVKGHPISCSLKEGCLKAGLGVITGGQFIKFDAEGTEKAAEVLKNTSRTSGVKVEVKGNLDDGILKVASISEVE